MQRFALLGMIGALLGGFGVALGAFGAHGLEGRLTERGMELYQTAVKYQMLHALAILITALFGSVGNPGGSLPVAGWSFAAGTLIFSGTLYAMALGGPRWLGAITPLGGLALIAGWIILAVSVWLRLR